MHTHTHTHATHNTHTPQGVNYAIQNGAHLSRAKVLFFKHNDLADLERLLAAQDAADRRSRWARRQRTLAAPSASRAALAWPALRAGRQASRPCLLLTQTETQSPCWARDSAPAARGTRPQNAPTPGGLNPRSVAQPLQEAAEPAVHRGGGHLRQHRRPGAPEGAQGAQGGAQGGKARGSGSRGSRRARRCAQGGAPGRAA